MNCVKLSWALARQYEPAPAGEDLNAPFVRLAYVTGFERMAEIAEQQLRATLEAHGCKMDEAWDIITLQQSSHDSGLPETYARQGEVTDYVHTHKRNPDGVMYWHMTWAYQQDIDHWAFPRYGCDQAAVYNALLHAVRSEILTNPAYGGIIPTGIAIQSLRATPVGDTVTRDGFHMSESHGRYAAALTWAQTLCGVDPDTVDWMPEAFADVIRPDLGYIREAVKAAGNVSLV